MIASFIILAIAGCMIIVAFGGDQLVWRIPSYNSFHKAVHRLENTQVISVRTRARVNATLRELGRYRLGELVRTHRNFRSSVHLMDCFGAMWFKEESIDEAVQIVKTNAAILIFVAFGGATYLMSDASQLEKVLSVDWYNRLPLIVGLLLENHAILMLELATLVVTGLSIFHSISLIRRTIKAIT